jgi:hypothetical protein
MDERVERMRNTLAASANLQWRAWDKEVPTTGQRVRHWLSHGLDKLSRLELLIQRGLDTKFDTPTTALEINAKDWPQKLDAAEGGAPQTAACLLAVAEGERTAQSSDYDGSLEGWFEDVSEAAAQAKESADEAAAAAALAAKAAANAASAAETVAAILRRRLEL